LIRHDFIEVRTNDGIEQVVGIIENPLRPLAACENSQNMEIRPRSLIKIIPNAVPGRLEYWQEVDGQIEKFFCAQ